MVEKRLQPLVDPVFHIAPREKESKEGKEQRRAALPCDQERHEKSKKAYPEGDRDHFEAEQRQSCAMHHEIELRSGLPSSDPSHALAEGMAELLPGRDLLLCRLLHIEIVRILLQTLRHHLLLFQRMTEQEEQDEKEKKGAKQRDDKDHRWFAPFLEIRVSP